MIASVISELDNKGVHNFSLGCLDSYFELNSGIQQNKVFWQHGVVIIKVRKPKFFVFSYDSRDKVFLENCQKESAVYSINPIPELSRESKFKEIAYDLEKVFDPESYPNSKKRHQRLVYPLRWLEKNGVTISELVEADYAGVEKLHKEWVAAKMADEKTFKMMFPTGRYLRCCRFALAANAVEQPTFFEDVVGVKIDIDYRGYVARMGDRIVSVRVVSVQNSCAYDLAFFTDTWNAPSQLSNYLDVYILKALKEKGIKLFNCGSALNSSLKTFKTHLPSKEVVSYMYSRVKEE